MAATHMHMQVVLVGSSMPILATHATLVDGTLPHASEGVPANIKWLKLTEVHPGTSQPSSYLPTGYLLGQDHSARLPGRQAHDWTSEGSSEDQDQGTDVYSGYLGILTDLIPCNNPSRSLPLLVTHGTWPIKAP